MQTRTYEPAKLKRLENVQNTNKKARMKMKRKNNSEKKLNVKTVNQVMGQKENLRGKILSTKIYSNINNINRKNVQTK